MRSSSPCLNRTSQQITGAKNLGRSLFACHNDFTAMTTNVGASKTRVIFWGVRGSIPTPGPGTVRYGGNTSCVEVRAEGEIIVLDAGSGIRLLGQSLQREFGSDPIRLAILISHTHWDHIQGLPFFLPAYSGKNQLRVFGYDGTRTRLGEILAGQMETPFFPVTMAELPGKIQIEELRDMDFAIGKLRVRSKFLNHPGVCAGYRIHTPAGSVVYMPDNEPFEQLDVQLRNRGVENTARTFKSPSEERTDLIQFLRGTDLLILDAQYTDEEYQRHIGWGHGSISSVVSLAADADAKRLVLFHHDPNHDDEMVDKIVDEARMQIAQLGKSIAVEGAREGSELILSRDRLTGTGAKHTRRQRQALPE
jgi:phosphoribosyl 1,2-cyclic phosphodiesterase